MDLNRPPKAGCPSDYALDLLRAGVAPPADAATINAHLAGCADCRARQAAFAAGFDAEPVDPRRLLAGARRRADEMAQALPWWRRWTLWVPALAACAAVALFVAQPRPASETIAPPPDGVRTKGDFSLHVLRSDSSTLVSGARVRPGEVVRFQADLPKGGHVAIIGIEADGDSYPVWPLDGAPQRALPAGKGQLLPGGFAFDVKPGTETLHLTLCSPVARCTVVDGALTCPSDCRSTPFEVVKRP